MKQLKSLIILSLMLFVGGQVMAQTHGATLLSASFPTNDFGDFDTEDFVLATDGDNAGAAIGFSLGFKWYFNVGVSGLDVMLSVDGMYNGLNAETKEFYKNRRDFLDMLGNNVEITRPSYINVPGMLGFKYTYYFNPSLGVFAEGGAGVNARFITDYTEKYTLMEQRLKSTVHYDPGFSFAWQMGIGVEVAKNLILECSYYNLGKTDVIAEKTGEIITTPMPYGDAEIRPSMILARIGFRY